MYPISNLNPPSTPTLQDEKKAIEEREKERRKRVLKGDTEQEEWWSMDKVESFYQECCQGCQERPDPTISAALKVRASRLLLWGVSRSLFGTQKASHTDPRLVDLSGIQLTFTSASILSDVFSIEWGLRKLVLMECDLDDLVCALWYSFDAPWNDSMSV